MNENIDLTKILRDCPKGFKLYSSVFGEVEFVNIYEVSRSIEYKINTGRNFDVSYDGKFFRNYDGECTLFPSKDQRDWSKFIAPWYKKDKFDPKTLKPFDKVLVRNCNLESWRAQLFSHVLEGGVQCPYLCICIPYMYCIPYNNGTKHLVGTNEEAPEFYRYWED